MSDAATYLAQKGVIRESAPAIARMVNAIAARFGVVVSEEVAAKAVPIIGAGWRQHRQCHVHVTFSGIGARPFHRQTVGSQARGPEQVRAAYYSLQGAKS